VQSGALRLLNRLKADLPHMIRVANGPKFLAQSLLAKGTTNRVLICHIQPGRLTQNASKAVGGTVGGRPCGRRGPGPDRLNEDVLHWLATARVD